MSADGDDGPGTREVAYRVFAAEYDDADYSWKESDEERAPTYVITPSGAKVNRMFLVGVLTEVEGVNEDMLRGRIVDPTGAFVVYAGQYQPDARAFFERADPPAFVAVTGKARTFQPEDSDRVFTSVRPESVNEVDADTRDRWVVTTAEATLSRVGTMARAIEGELEPGETTGPGLARAHYDTSPAYLAGLRDLSLSAARVVAGERDEVDPLTVDPDAPGQADTGALATLADESAVEAVAGGDDEAAAGTDAAEQPGETAAEATGSAGDGSGTAPGDDATTAGEETTTAGEEAEPATASAGEGSAGVSGDAGTEPTGEAADGTPAEAVESASGSGDDDAGGDESIGDFESGGDLGDFDADDGATADEPGPAEAEDAGEAVPGDATGDAGEQEADAEDATGEPAATTNGEGEVSGQPDEMYELDEDERREIEEEYDTEFSTGTEVDAPGEAGIDTPEPDDSGEPTDPGDEGSAAGEAEAPTEVDDDVDEEPEPAEESADVDGAEESTDADEEGDEEADEETDEEPEADLDEVLMETMRDLDGGDGADRAELIAQVTDATGASPGAVEDAIQDALMGGQCYEPDDETLKPI